MRSDFSKSPPDSSWGEYHAFLIDPRREFRKRQGSDQGRQSQIRTRDLVRDSPERGSKRPRQIHISFGRHRVDDAEKSQSGQQKKVNGGFTQPAVNELGQEAAPQHRR